jgi:hypothetical protein
MIYEKGLIKELIPENLKQLPENQLIPIYRSADSQFNQQSLLVLIQGSGGVRPGVWS